MTLRARGFRIHLHRRTHHPEISFGAWMLCVNGIQFFAGRFAVTFNWPSALFEWKFKLMREAQ